MSLWAPSSFLDSSFDSVKGAVFQGPMSQLPIFAIWWISTDYELSDYRGRVPFLC